MAAVADGLCAMRAVSDKTFHTSNASNEVTVRVWLMHNKKKEQIVSIATENHT